jgi:hypothetical protein
MLSWLTRKGVDPIDGDMRFFRRCWLRSHWSARVVVFISEVHGLSAVVVCRKSRQEISLAVELQSVVSDNSLPVAKWRAPVCYTIPEEACFGRAACGGLLLQQAPSLCSRFSANGPCDVTHDRRSGRDGWSLPRLVAAARTHAVCQLDLTFRKR